MKGLLFLIATSCLLINGARAISSVESSPTISFISSAQSRVGLPKEDELDDDASSFLDLKTKLLELYKQKEGDKFKANDGIELGHINEMAKFENQSQNQSQSQSQSQSEDEDEPQTYGIIVDCGSSGTRAHIYQWDTSRSYPDLLHDIAPMRDPTTRKPVSRKFTPGVSSLADKSRQETDEYIKQIADYVSAIVPKDRHANTVIYMLATAGMRLLDEETQERIMNDIRDYVEDNYDFADVKTSVIPGSYEGMYQWISVNAKAKRFLGHDTSGRTKTYAVIEMGGASVQVTYQLRPGYSNFVASKLPDHVKATYLAQRVEPALSRRDSPDNTYLLHSTTFLGFGGNSAREAYLDLLIKKHYTLDYMKKFYELSSKVKNFFTHCFKCFTANKKDNKKTSGNTKNNKQERILTIRDPCAPKGFVTDELKKPRRMLEVNNQTIGFIAEDDEETFSLRVQGTGQYNKCRKYVEEMLRLAKEERLNCKEDEPDSSCTMLLVGESFIPFNLFDFLGIGDIYYTLNTMLKSTGTYNRETILAKTKEICQTPYEKLKGQFPEIASNEKLADRLDGNCFKAVWVDTFLVKALRMPQNFDMLKTIGQINGDDLEWTLGAVLDKSLAIEEATESADEEKQRTELQLELEPEPEAEQQPLPEAATELRINDL